MAQPNHIVKSVSIPAVEKRGILRLEREFAALGVVPGGVLRFDQNGKAFLQFLVYVAHFVGALQPVSSKAKAD